MTATRGPQVVLEGYARDVARGGGGKTMRDNMQAMDQLISAGLVADGNAVDGSSRTGGQPYDPVVAQFPHAPVPAWEVPAPLLDISAALAGGGGPFLPLAGNATVTGPVLFSGPLNYMATGASAVRAAQDRAADWVNLRDCGGMLDGATNDTAAFAAARVAAAARHPGSGGVVQVPFGIQANMTAPTYVAPPVLWKLDGLAFSGGTPVTSITQGDLVETFFSGQKYLGRVDPPGQAGGPVLRLDFSGAGTANGMLMLNTTSTNANTFLWNLTSVLKLTMAGNGQMVGIASEVTHLNGSAQRSWGLFTSNADTTGVGSQAPKTLNGYEANVIANGVDASTAYWNPHAGGRVNIHVINSNYDPPAYAANRVYALGAVVTPGNSFTYFASVAGTSGGTPPVWPTSAGTVVDGGVTWTFGTTVQAQVSRAIEINGNANLGAAILIDGIGMIQDACIEMCTAVLDKVTNPNAAAIRMAADMPIDFSGNGTALGQNLHTLQYRSATQRFYYTVAGVDVWSIDASGNVRARGTFTPSTTP